MEIINYTHHEDFHNEKAALEVLPFVFNLKQIRSVIDIGCGLGTWLSAAKKLGVKEVKGIDGIRVTDKMFKLDNDEFTQHDLSKRLRLNRKYDLGICLEVVEHLPESAADNLIDIITEHSDFILFSAAIPNQTGDHHYNEQWPSYWQEKFEKKAFYPYDIIRNQFWENENVDWWYRQNMILYGKGIYTGLGACTKTIPRLVHPELLNSKEEQIKHLNRLVIDHIFHPRFFSSIKKVIMSILKK